MAERDMDGLEYATDYEKMYGVTDERHAYLCRIQDQLARFDTSPSAPRADKALLARLANQRDILARSGFDPAKEDHILETVRVDFVHATARIEGNTLSLKETGLVLEQDAVIPGKPLREHVEVLDIAAAFDLMVEQVRGKGELSAETILAIHRAAGTHLEDCDLGEYRSDQRYVSSSPVIPPPPARVPQLIDDLVTWAASQGGSPIETAALFHLVFEDVHPFQEGNGRTGRVLLNFMLMSAGYPPISLKADKDGVAAYYQAIDSFVRDISGRDGSKMVDLVAHRLEDSVGQRMLQLEQVGA